MIEFIKIMYKKYEELFWYLVVGVITTIVSLGVKFLWNYFVFGHPLNPTVTQTFILSIVNWVSGVETSYPLSRKFVFKSHGPILKEMASFHVSRLSTWALDLFITEVFGPGIGLNVYLTTGISMVLVVILNYVFSKVFVFKKKESQSDEKEV
ncbi:MAG: GtrA family protein [Lachnospiraceae bacterium]|nr:GtrA family protein [Lachnospiraceae bacterium]